jgi:hypothetical protein
VKNSFTQRKARESYCAPVMVLIIDYLSQALSFTIEIQARADMDAVQRNFDFEA